MSLKSELCLVHHVDHVLDRRLGGILAKCPHDRPNLGGCAGPISIAKPS